MGGLRKSVIDDIYWWWIRGSRSASRIVQEGEADGSIPTQISQLVTGRIFFEKFDADISPTWRLGTLFRTRAATLSLTTVAMIEYLRSSRVT